MTPTELDEVVGRVCGDKRRYPDVAATRPTQRRMRSQGEHVTPYRCPFHDGRPHWHLGHPPSLAAVARIADAIRARAQGTAS